MRRAISAASVLWLVPNNMVQWLKNQRQPTLLMAIKFLILCSLAASPRDSSLALFICVFCTHTKTINMFLECCKSEICSDFFHQLKWWMCWAVWEQQRGQAAVRESSPLPSPHAGFKQGTCRTFLTNGLIYAAIVSFSSGYSFHMDFFLSPCSIQKQYCSVFCISWYEICHFKTVLGAALSYYGPPFNCI